MNWESLLLLLSLLAQLSLFMNDFLIIESHAVFSFFFYLFLISIECIWCCDRKHTHSIRGAYFFILKARFCRICLCVSREESDVRKIKFSALFYKKIKSELCKLVSRVFMLYVQLFSSSLHLIKKNVTHVTTHKSHVVF